MSLGKNDPVGRGRCAVENTPPRPEFYIVWRAPPLTAEQGPARVEAMAPVVVRDLRVRRPRERETL